MGIYISLVLEKRASTGSTNTSNQLFCPFFIGTTFQYDFRSRMAGFEADISFTQDEDGLEMTCSVTTTDTGIFFSCLFTLLSLFTFCQLFVYFTEFVYNFSHPISCWIQLAISKSAILVWLEWQIQITTILDFWLNMSLQDGIELRKSCWIQR